MSAAGPASAPIGSRSLPALWRVAIAVQVLAGSDVRCNLVFIFGTNDLSRTLPWPVSKNCFVKSASFGLRARLFVDGGLRLAAVYNTEADKLKRSAFFLM